MWMDGYSLIFYVTCTDFDETVFSNVTYINSFIYPFITSSPDEHTSQNLLMYICN